ncbi:MAG: DUF4382 domain-containing protein [Flavobacteriaceae bacterium]|nr:DUF4382 domain-containing protein [Flavobacteriaceae bacterium]
MKPISLTRPFLGLIILFLMQACSEPQDTFSQEERTTVAVTLVSTSASYDQVNIDIKNVLLKVVDNESDPNCWLSLDADNTGVFNMSELSQAGSTLLVGDRDIPEGVMYEIWLELGENNFLVKDGQTFDLSTPYAHQSGLKVRSQMLLKADNSYGFELQFHLEESIVETNVDGYFILKPVLSLDSNTYYPIGS